MIPPHAHRTVRALTLIELLVVLAVIGVLVALLMPATASMRAGARSLRCQTSLRQIHCAYGAYAQDQNGLVARASIQDWKFWYQYIADYAEATNGDAMSNPDSIRRTSVIWDCAGWDKKASVHAWWAPPFGINMWMMEPVREPVTNWRYGNGWYPPGDGWRGYFREFRFATIDRASTRALAGDSQYWFYAAGTTPTRHKSGYANTVFCDGHVAPLNAVQQRLTIDDPTRL